jgi:hypothetical protein
MSILGPVGHRHGDIFRYSLTWDTKHSQGPFPFPKTRMNDSTLPTLKRSFRSRLKQVHDQGHNAIFIFEGCHKFDEPHVAALAHFLQPLFRTRIIVSYRRLFEWLPSKYNSIHKPIRNQDIANWPGRFHVLRSGKLSKSLALLPFHLNFDQSDHSDDDNNDMNDGFDQLVLDIVAAQQHPTQTIRDNYAKYFDHVHVIPLHALPDNDATIDNPAARGYNATWTASTSPYLYHLFCKILVETTPQICRALAQGEFQRLPYENPSLSLDYDRIAVAAHQRGWIPTNASRGEVAQHVQKYMYNAQQQRVMQDAEKNDNTETPPRPTTPEQQALPRECLPNTILDRLLNLSLATEENLFGHEIALQWQEDHRRAFELYRQRSKYCFLDTNKLLDQNEEWKSFLQSLGQRFAMKEEETREAHPS